MPLAPGSKNLYLKAEHARVLARFSADELAILVDEGAGLFSRLALTDDAKGYLAEHPKLAEVIDKW